MRLAVLADIHGNLIAFEAALAHARAQGVDQIIIAGDIVNGSPDSVACWQLARSLGCPMLRGNHERYVADLGTARADPSWSTAQFAPLHWTAAQLSGAERAAIGDLPAHLRLPDLLVVHASLRNDTDTLRAHTPEDLLPAMFPEGGERLIVRGHNHIGATYLWGARRVVTVGSVGLPLNSIPTAQYMILDRERDGWYAVHHSVPYDLDAALARFEETGYLRETGVMGRLFQRELATASFQLVPFLRSYQRLAAQAPITLEDALAHYLAV